MGVFSLDGKIALITGASRGIGEAIALLLAEHGAHCILTSRKAAGLEAVAETIRKKGGKADVITCHMGELQQIDGLMGKIEQQFGRLDILVSNAATNPYFGEMTGCDEGAWDKIMDVNLKGPFFLMKAAAKLMEKGGGGSIVTVSSINGISPAPFQGVYAISKAGVIATTKAFAKELATKNIRVNSLLPGLTDTKFAEALISNDSIRDYAINQIPMKRYADPSEMAGAVLYLVSDAASFTTGSCIICDGGMMA